MWLRGVPEEKRRRCKTFDEFIDRYFKVIYDTEMKLRKDFVAITSMFDEGVDESAPKPPYDHKKVKEESRTRRKHGRDRGRFSHSTNALEEDAFVAKVSEAGDPVTSSDDSDGEVYVKKISGADYDDDVDSVDSESKEEGALAESKNQDDEWLNGIVMDPKGVRSAPCWEFAKTGKCKFEPNCKFSHHEDDIKAYNVAKKLGESEYRLIANKPKQWQSHTGLSTSRTGFGSSPGVRPKVPAPTSILKSGGFGGARKEV
jgi:hypothetical protein